MAGLVKYDALLLALFECKVVDEVKAIADKGAAIQAYGRIARDKTVEIGGAEIRIRAERELGKMLAQQKESVGLAKPGPKNNSVVSDDRSPKLAEAGISKDLSARSQKLAAVPEEEFESEVEGWRDRVEAEGARVTARLEAAGDRATKKQAKAVDVIDGDVEESKSRISELEAENEELKDQLHEMASLMHGLQEELEAARRILDAEDLAAQFAKEVKRAQAMASTVQSRNNGLMNENSDLKGRLKSALRKIERLEKTAKNACKEAEVG